MAVEERDYVKESGCCPWKHGAMAFFLSYPLLPAFETAPLQQGDGSVEENCNEAEDDNGHNHSSKLENLAGIDNQVPQAVFAANHFTDNNADKGKTDINFHNA